MSDPLANASEDRPRVVEFGTSAGGLDALKELLGAMPTDSGMAFVVGQHLGSAHESRMAEILTRGGRGNFIALLDSGSLSFDADRNLRHPPRHQRLGARCQGSG